MHCLRSVSLILILWGSACSTINTAYYARPQAEFLSSETCKTGSMDDGVIPCARLVVEGIELTYWAVTTYHPTMRGPCLLPVYPVDAPILDSFDVRLFWRVLLPANLKGTSVSILKSSIMASAGGRVDQPTGITIYRMQDGSDRIESYISPRSDTVPETFPLSADSTFELWYNTIFYAETESFSVQPSFLVNGKPVRGPRVEFTAEKDRKYSPFEFPFMIAPVR